MDPVAFARWAERWRAGARWWIAVGFGALLVCMGLSLRTGIHAGTANAVTAQVLAGLFGLGLPLACTYVRGANDRVVGVLARAVVAPALLPAWNAAVWSAYSSLVYRYPPSGMFRAAEPLDAWASGGDGVLAVVFAASVAYAMFKSRLRWFSPDGLRIAIGLALAVSVGVAAALVAVLFQVGGDAMGP